ncbi:NAD(P)/FAD-dependent oxidoreductase [Maricaulis salignorans]|uniref:NAD(P)/FAD-dependent oxidoreductase n=1 Tax=Maricaulis salignorans TaxID=144026 RepID=UPI003A95CE0E
MTEHSPKQIAIIGGGPAGLIAAERLSARGHSVTVYERMPTLGRKFLMAGRGGLNLTHSDDREAFVARYREASGWMSSWLEVFTPADLCAWAESLGQETFVGSSGRVFPKAMKASPLLRAWIARLEAQGVEFHLRHQWTGWGENGELLFHTPDGDRVVDKPDAVLLALGGASWPKLGSDAGWVEALRTRDVEIQDFAAANCGVEIAWSEVMKSRFAGKPLKTISISLNGETVRGEAMISNYGLEGGAVYALSTPIRKALATGYPVTVTLDLRPNHKIAEVAARLSEAKKGQSLANTLRKAGLSPEAISVLREGGELPTAPADLARRIKAAPLTITGQTGLERAISSSGGIARDGLDIGLMLKARPGVFVAGEMIDWEAPTGGYLLQGCFSTGIAAARGIETWMGLEAKIDEVAPETPVADEVSPSEEASEVTH